MNNARKIGKMIEDGVDSILNESPKDREIILIRNFHCEWCDEKKYGHLFMVNPNEGAGSRHLLFNSEKLKLMSMDELRELHRELENGSPWAGQSRFG